MSSTEIARFSERFRKLLEIFSVPDDFIEIAEIALSDALRTGHRRIFLLSGASIQLSSIFSTAIADVLHRFHGRELRILYASHSIEKDAEAASRYQVIRRDVSPYGDFGAIIYAWSEQVLGKTFDLAILDLTRTINPNDLGIIIETVRGGGAIVMISPPIGDWVRMKTLFHESLVTPPYTLDHVETRFHRRFIQTLLEARGVCLLDFENERVSYNDSSISPIRRREKILPEKMRFKKILYELCATQDQVEALKRMERLEKGRPLVLIADRGRGKSAVLGIGIAGLVKSRKMRNIVVVAPDISNALEVFNFAALALEKLGIEFSRYSDAIVGRDFAIRFRSPAEIKDADLIVVDEAAGIHVSILNWIVRNFDYCIFSSTIHGYEGAGRGFYVKFLKRREGTYDLLILEEPIRYNPGDPIEEWLNKALFLRAEPADLDDVDLEDVEKGDVEYIAPDLDRWFEREEDQLEQFVGIYVLAHYQNRPNDIAMLADAPHHFARALRTKRGGKIVGALQLAREGRLPRDVIKQILDGMKLPGNVIPYLVIRNFRDERFGKLAGLRIVRIAVHPQLFGKGLGSRLLSELSREFDGQLDWLGAGFGADEQLVRFWMKNGYMPVHLSPQKNVSSGEYSCIVIKPMNERCEKLVTRYATLFKKRLSYWLQEIHRDLDPGAAVMMFESRTPPIDVELDDDAIDRLDQFCSGVLFYEAGNDAVRELARKYFLDSPESRPELSFVQKKILLMKCLQLRSWDEIAREIGWREMSVIIELKDIVRKLYNHYYR